LLERRPAAPAVEFREYERSQRLAKNSRGFL
jgi:hypothetical protein